MGRERLIVRSPWDLTEVASLEPHGPADVEAALAESAALHRKKRNGLSADLRTAILERTAACLSRRRDELALLIAREGGKPLRDARIEADRAIEGVKLSSESLRTVAGHQVPMTGPAACGRTAFTYHEPIGPVVAISAFNHPLNLIVHQVAPAVAAGCPVIVKPSADTPLSCQAFVEILHESGLPEAWCRMIVTADNALAETLVTDPRVAFFSFIGSSRVGWHLRSRLAAGTRCALEHGGVAPVIVASDADLDDVIPLLVRGGFYHAGQVCVSVQRVFVEASIADDFAARIAAAANALQVADPTTEDADLGPLIRPGEVDRVETWVDEALAKGGHAAAGGRRLSATSFAPTVVVEPPRDSRLMTQEVFGPVVAVSRYRSVDEAIERANALPFAFQAAVCTRDLDRAINISARLDASAVMVNDHTAFRVDWMPFAGRRQSGLGVGGIEHSMREMLQEKMIVLRTKGDHDAPLC
ncbi:MAG: aldehyde dehydrogenase family protein [Planctomycetes bacterium]|nr:aldehyde dehydrogenase family protein [Planctomycetota bacterium]